MPGAGGYREVIALAVPLILSMVSQTLMLAIESALLGRVDPVAQGASGLASALKWPLLLLCNCGGTGVQICVAQALGAGRLTECGVVAWQGIYLSCLAWLVPVLAGLHAPWIVQLSAPSPELIAPTVLYLRIAWLGSLPGMVNLIIVGCFRGLGDTRTPLLVTLVIDSLNVVLDIVLIFGLAGLPPLGIAGAAIAAVLANTIGVTLSFTLFWRRGQRQGFLSQRRLPFVRQTCWQVLQVSWPIGTYAALEMTAWTLFTAFIARLGTTEAAAHAIAVRVIALCYTAGLGISITATTLIGRYLGAADRLAMRRTIRTSLMLLLGLMSSLGVGLFVWRQPLVGLFSEDAAVTPLARQLLIFAALFQIFDALTLLGIGVLRGTGQTRWPMFIGVAVNWGLFIPSAVLVMFVWSGGVLGGWAVALATGMVLGLLLLGRVWRYLW
jgi:putative MATE family efflux protein